ncbi:regulatory protein GemA [Agrobacterium tumefaciens]|uniref:regulatory protein GemA n=1 Tax=Agrobacterium tumefaciens TaxID=358 RepID=UPI0021D15C80|nr:regulatory protein GemA [Agrobacterium tumefaciens]UXS52571.1 regulatory protein GemA [Agrobacterium tumefaciens]UXS62817.1 regulatory protein GemA [Agrobacterium tumefaciens]
MSIQRAIFGGFRQLGITEEDAQRAIYSRVTGQPRLSLMTPKQQDAVMLELRRLGYKPVAVRGNARRRLDGRYAPKMQSLWIAAYNLGIVEDREDRALEAFVKRQTGLDSGRWVNNADDARAVVEALKSWIAREAGVVWPDRKPCEAYTMRYGYKIAIAQHAMLKSMLGDGFWPSVTGILDQEITYRAVTDKEWIMVMDYYGKLIRGRRAPKKKASA